VHGKVLYLLQKHHPLSKEKVSAALCFKFAAIWAPKFIELEEILLPSYVVMLGLA